MKMFCMLLLLFVTSLDSVITRQTYIVHVKSPQNSQTLEEWYHSFLPDTTARIGHKYRHVITGFSAKLSLDELKEMQKLEGFINARPQKVYTLQTTHSPNFLGLHQNIGSWKTSNYGKGVIIGVLDSGVVAGHPSFRDEGVPPPPATWKGKCELTGLPCNNKVIGARSFVSFDPRGGPADRDGHGTHTASIAAGNFVPGASAVGQANGTASGMSPLAHLAVYKVCRYGLCFESDVVAGMDAAVEDGVDIISMSIGGSSSPFYEDGMAIAAFSAVEKGIFVSCAANNRGPSGFSLANEAPWILTVGASTIDRMIVATVILGNQDEYEGQSLYQKSDFPSELLPLVYAGDLGNDEFGVWCGPGSLDKVDVKGKVVLCQRGGGVGRVEKGRTVKNAGGAAMILMNDNSDAFSTLVDAHVLPVSHVSYDAGEKIKEYIKSSGSTSTATILFKGTKIGDEKASSPVVASFSSRGPNLASPGILKPDIIGPGSSILAAWPTSINNYTNENMTFNVVSGTSMSCPHLSGIATLIKNRHPEWSPAMIKSAIMTSATQTNLNSTPILDEKNVPAGVFAIGAGHVNPTKALDPGLVYDISTPDYISYLCSLYTEMQVEVIVNRRINCNTSEYKDVPEAQLNYPSIAVQLGYTNTSQGYSRTVTNVGDAESTYYVQIENVPGVNMTVQPTILSFTMVKQRKTYNISFSRKEYATNESYVQGSIAWVSPQHIVRIPVSVHLVFTNETSMV